MTAYEDWIKSRSAERVLLCEMDGYNPTTTSVETIKVSTEARGDFQNFLPVIMKTPIIRRSIEELVPSSGFIEIDNTDGKFDHLMYHNFNNRQIRFWHGDASWSFLSGTEFQQIYTGVIDGFEFISDNTLRVDFSGGEKNLDVDVQNTRLTTNAATGKRPPICYGAVRRITPVLIDEAARRYKIHDGPIQAISTVYADGVSVAFTANTANGTFTLNAAQAGKRITCTAIGAAPTGGGTAYRKAGDIIEDMLVRHGHLTAGEIDTASLTAYDANAPAIGVFWDDAVNLLEAIQTIMDCHAGWYMFNRDGKFALKEAVDLNATPPATSIFLSDDNIIGDLKVTHADTPPVWKVTIGYNKNWSPDPESNTEALFEPYYYVSDSVTEATHKTKYADSVELEYLTNIETLAGATAEAEFRMDLFEDQHYLVSPQSHLVGFQVDLGDIAEITSDRFMLTDQKFVITDIEEDMLQSISTVSGWF